MNLLIRFFCSEYIIAFTNDKLTIFSWGNRLQFFLALSYGLQFLSTFPLNVKGSVGIFESPHLFGQFPLVSSVRVLEGFQVISVLFFEVSGY